MSVDSHQLRLGILYHLMMSEDYTRKVLPFIQEEYFTVQSEKILFDEISKYFNTYNQTPKASALSIEIESRSDLTENVYQEINKVLEKANDVKQIDKIEWLVNKTENWCQERAIVNAVYKAVDVISGEDRKIQMTALPTLLQEAIGTTFDKSVGHDYIDDAENRWEFYNNKEEKLETGLEHFDYILRGGIPSKTLGVLMAGTGVGKSLFMCSISSSLLERGNNVLYITMEMAEEKIAQRIDQNLLDLTGEELDQIGKDSFLKRFGNLRSKTQGQLVVKEYPTGSAHAGHFRHLLSELRMKRDFKADVVFIDYLNICASSRVKGAAAANSYTLVKSIAEELRGLAMEFNCAIVTSSQFNRDAYGNSDVDCILGLVSSEDLDSLGQIMIKQLKNRWGDIGYYRRFVVGIDRAKMQIFDLEDSAQQGLTQGQTANNASSISSVKTRPDDLSVFDKTAFGQNDNQKKKLFTAGDLI
jgi:replicative DNA helicase